MSDVDMRGLTFDQYMRLSSACFDPDTNFEDVADIVVRLIAEAKFEALERAAQNIDVIAAQNCEGCPSCDGGFRNGLRSAAFTARAEITRVPETRAGVGE